MRVHDYTTQGWGHSLGPMVKDIDERRAKYRGFGPFGLGIGTQRIAAGDVLLCKTSAGNIELVVESIEYLSDPKDMFYAVLRYDGEGQQEGEA